MSPARFPDTDVDAAVQAVIAAGRWAASRHWVPATAGNFSARIDSRRIAITRTGVDKGHLTETDILIQPLAAPLLPGSSAEAPLHVRLYQDDPDIGAVFHAHGLYGTVLGQAHCAEGVIHIEGWELQKVLSGITTHEQCVDVPIFANDQDTVALALRVADRFAQPASAGHRIAPAYLLAGHGLYAWGRTPQDAQRHFEGLEVLFQQMVTLRNYTKT